MSFSIVLNGRDVHVGEGAPHATLLDFIRARGLTGAKEGCAEGECGACAVAMVAEEQGRASYRVVNSCLMLLPTAADREFYTVESLAQHGTLSEVQQAMAAAGGSQCGYCTPGFVMSLFAEQHRRDREGPCDPLALSGNLCRCTGYRPIRDAARAVVDPPTGRFRERLDAPVRALEACSVDGFSRPTSLRECSATLQAHPDAKLIAGSTDLGVDFNLRLTRWPWLISVEAIPELHECVETDASIRIGAALPLSDIARRWTRAPAVVGQWLDLFASPPIRNRATLGGNLATASPIGDAAPLLLALNASILIAGPAGRRSHPIGSFFTGYRKTALREGELITAVEIPKPLPAFVRFYKVAKRRLDDISTVAAAMSVDRDTAGRVRSAVFAFGGVAPTPVAYGMVELDRNGVGGVWNEAAVERVRHSLERVLSPVSDHRGSKEYRREVAMSLVERFWWEARDGERR